MRTAVSGKRNHHGGDRSGGKEEKAWKKIMAHIAPEAKIAFLPEMVERVAVWRIDIDIFTGKERRRK